MSVESAYRPRLAYRHAVGTAFRWITAAGALLGIVLLALLLTDVARDGTRLLSWDFLNAFPSRFPEQAGFKAALWGSIWVIGFTALFSFPIGVGAALYLEEYSGRGRLTRLIQLNISNLAGVPSIVFGILGLQLFVRGTLGFGPDLGGFGRSVIAGSLTLTLLILPIVIVAAQESVRAVPSSIREASYGVGATRWQTV